MSKPKIIIIAIIVSLTMFSWGHARGERVGYVTQASYTRFKFPEEGWSNINQLPRALDQFTPFPANFIQAVASLLTP